MENNKEDKEIQDIIDDITSTAKDLVDEYVSGDLRDPDLVSQVMFAPNQKQEQFDSNSFDEVYQLAADMGGAGYIFTGDNDANVMHNSGLVNLNTVHECLNKKVKKVFYLII